MSAESDNNLGILSCTSSCCRAHVDHIKAWLHSSFLRCLAAFAKQVQSRECNHAFMLLSLPCYTSVRVTSMGYLPQVSTQPAQPVAVNALLGGADVLFLLPVHVVQMSVWRLSSSVLAP